MAVCAPVPQVCGHLRTGQHTWVRTRGPGHLCWPDPTGRDPRGPGIHHKYFHCHVPKLRSLTFPLANQYNISPFKSSDVQNNRMEQTGQLKRHTFICNLFLYHGCVYMLYCCFAERLAFKETLHVTTLVEWRGGWVL